MNSLVNNIVNADDFGRSETTNKAIALCFKKRFINRTTVMANMPFFNEAIEVSRKEGFFDRVGLHINLDDGEPLTDEMKKNHHFCKNGRFIDRVFLNPKYRFVLSLKDMKCIYAEVRAQMKKYIDAGFNLKHFDSHHFVHNNLSLIFIISRVGKEFGFKSARIMEMSKYDSVFKKFYKRSLNFYLSRNFETSSQFVQSFKNYQEKKGDAEFMTHPDIVDSKLVNIVSWDPYVYSSFDIYASFLRK